MVQTVVGGQSTVSQPGQTLQSVSNLIDNALSEVRVLRDAILQAHNKINAAINGDVEVPELYWKSLVERLTRANRLYEYFKDFEKYKKDQLIYNSFCCRELENHARSLPSTPVSFPQMERLTRFLNEAHIDPHIKDLYERALEASTWVETSAQFLLYYVGFLRRISLGSQRRSLIVDRPLTYTSHNVEKCLQQAFDQIFPQAVSEINKKLVLNYRYIERSTLSAVIELKYGAYAEKLFACHQKMLIMVNNGVIESVLIIAPHEDWAYLDEGRKTVVYIKNMFLLCWIIVDILKKSRYTVYQKLTIQANIHLVQTINNYMDASTLTVRAMVYVLTVLSRFHETINFRCKVCNRTMKNCLPPTIFDIRSQSTQGLHESCR
uniref:Conserved oligomeric Golgi complex subunit 3 n=1 Tax=Syphacia muris TaxID=451379 RepID=A0A0N5A7N2_9BILA